MSLHSRCVVVEQRDLANPGQLILKLQCRPSRVDWLIEHKSSSRVAGRQVRRFTCKTHTGTVPVQPALHCTFKAVQASGFVAAGGGSCLKQEQDQPVHRCIMQVKLRRRVFEYIKGLRRRKLRYIY